VSADPEKVIDEILDGVTPTFEKLEARSLAVFRFLKAKSIATDEELQPFLEEATNASEIEWRAGRLRLHHLFMAAIQAIEQSATNAARKADDSRQEAPADDKAESKETARKHEKGEKQVGKSGDPSEGIADRSNDEKQQSAGKRIDAPKTEEESPAEDAADPESQSHSQAEDSGHEASKDAA
jgi:hypothetical protein